MLNVAGIPFVERFSFCLTTLLSDIAFLSEESKEIIFSVQVLVLEELTVICRSAFKDDNRHQHKKKSKCLDVENFVIDIHTSLLNTI